MIAVLGPSLPTGSSLAESVDTLLYVWLALAGTVAFALAVLIVYFAAKYRHGSASRVG